MKFIVVMSLFVATTSAALLTTHQPIGRRKVVDPNNPVVKQMIMYAFTRIKGSINTAHAIKLGKVVKTESQVVAGVKYYITLEVEETDCRRDQTDLTHCSVIRTEVCDVVVVSRPWLQTHKKILLSQMCQAK